MSDTLDNHTTDKLVSTLSALGVSVLDLSQSEAMGGPEAVGTVLSVSVLIQPGVGPSRTTEDILIALIDSVQAQTETP